MTYVVTESCIRCKYTDCVDVCPVDCFREGPNFLVIDPDECIDCTLCVAECPVEAIYAEDDVPDDQKPFTSLNAELAKLWKPIIERKPAPPDADEWKSVKAKRDLLEPIDMTCRDVFSASLPRRFCSPRWPAAQGALARGDAAAGSQKTQMCVGCHGIPGWRTAYPEVYKVPKLGGQHEAYLAKALQEYRSGARSHPSMRAIATSLSDKDIADLAAYYAGAAAKTASK